MRLTPAIAVGTLMALSGAYVYLNASWEFDAGMRLRDVDPESIDEGSRRSGIRRNEVVGLLFVLLGIGVVIWGLFG